MPFHKTCYTRRSSGYKYRTLSTNTGETKKVQRQIILPPPNPIDQKFHSIHDDVSALISKEIDETNRSRTMFFEKFAKIDAKINSIVEMQNDVLAMRESLNSAEQTLGDLYERVQKMEVMSELNSIKFRKSPNRIKSGGRVVEDDIEQEIFHSEIAEQPSVTIV